MAQQRRKIDLAHRRKKKEDAWAHEFLELQALLHPKKGEGAIAYLFRAGVVINDLPDLFRERAKQMFWLLKKRRKIETRQVHLTQKRMALKQGLMRAR